MIAALFELHHVFNTTRGQSTTFSSAEYHGKIDNQIVVERYHLEGLRFSQTDNALFATLSPAIVLFSLEQ